MTLVRLKSRLGAEVRYTGLSAWRGLVNLVNSNDLTFAASIAYYALLSLFPFLLLIVSILGAVTASDEQRAAVLTFVFRYFPTRLDFVTDQLDSLQQSKFRAGLAGGLALVWASLGVFGAVTSAVNAAWRVDKQRSYLKHRFVSFLMLVAAGAALLVALLLVSAAQAAQASWFGTVLARYTWLNVVLTWVTPYLAMLLLILSVGLVFYFIPNAKTRLRDVWVGAVLTGVLWRAAFSGFAWYIAYNQSLAVIHGSIAAVVVFLLWIYVSAIILMFGVEFTASYARLRRNRSEEMPVAASPRT